MRKHVKFFVKKCKKGQHFFNLTGAGSRLTKKTRARTGSAQPKKARKARFASADKENDSPRRRAPTRENIARIKSGRRF